MAGDGGHTPPTQSEAEDDLTIYIGLPAPVYRQHNAPERPFCWEDDCPCRDDKDSMNQLNEWYQEGLIGPVDGDLIYRGQTF